MPLTRIIVDKDSGKVSEESVPENFKAASDEEIARRTLKEKERTRRQPFDALNPKDQVNHPVPQAGRKKAEEKPEEEADIRESPEGGKTKGKANPTEAEPEEPESEDTDEDEEE